MRAPFPLLSRLREETSSAHQELELIVDINSTLQNREAYEQLLAGFYGFHASVEQILESAPVAGEGYDPAQRRKSPWLAEDLRALGWSGEKIAGLPQCRAEDLPILTDPASVLGCAYVMEGSTLGGRHISALLEKESGIPREARRFFQSYGEETRAKWLQFLNTLAEFGASAGIEEHNRAILSARKTFECMGNWMKAEVLHEH